MSTDNGNPNLFEPKTISISDRVQTEREVLFKAMAIVGFVERRLLALTGDEQSTDICMWSADWTYALSGATDLLNASATRMEKLVDETRTQVVPQ